ncbi:LuxR C-terminal-related transcriptional regulator [Cellulomonas sp. S1-8]|uniref:LuxR C-terminal-related transcriptional regulator n=1 Tax=Cellulomonas sp. S1-8 TaxID=2904790 RepID=UPI002242E010|nr:LuxR C-terminal-related transcriptional regulator [Cellulomonas sp. S1-8]UZN02979.1 LuxR C-terminal-related transcriptional regulator [Cellulomonas sp. S1-8]
MTARGSPPGDDRRGGGVVGTPAWALPQGPVNAVVRSRLLDRLDRLERVAIIRAATGYGRTVLAAQWASAQRAAGRPVAWTARPWHQDDPWSVVRDALTVALRARGVDVPDAASPGALAAAVDAAATLVVLVVDDADELDDPAAVTAVAELLATAPALRLVLVTGPRYPLLPAGAQHPVLAAVGSPLPVVTVTARDLAFTAEELRAAAASWGHPVDDARLAGLVALVGGWPRLAREVLDDTRPDDDQLATAGAYAFARDVVLPSLGDAPLLETAMLVAADADPTPETVRLTLDSAGRRSTDDAVAVLLELENVGCLLRDRTAGSPSRWHYPVLLREALRQELDRRDPALVARVHSALARTALTADPPDPRRAVEHAAGARDWTLLETCWLDYGPYLVAAGGPTVDAAYAAIPDEVAETSTVLTMARAMARRGRDGRDDVRAVVLRLMKELGVLALDGAWRSRTPAGRWIGAASALVTARSRGDMARAMAVLRDTEVAAARAGRAGDTASRPYWWFLVQAARTALVDGDPGGSLELGTRAYELANPALAPDVRSAAAAHVALAHALDGALLDADRWLVRYVEALDPDWEEVMRDDAAAVAEALLAVDQLDLAAVDAALSRLDIEVHAPDPTWPLVLRARARRAVLFGDAETALAQLEHVERTQPVWVEQPAWVRGTVLRIRTELLLALGELHRASDLLDQVDPSAAWADVPRTRWHLLTGDPHAAVRLAARGTRRRGNSLADRRDLLVLEAWAAHESGQPDRAVTAFRSARRLAGPQGALSSFAQLPGAVRESLVDATDLPFDDIALARLAATGRVGDDPVRLVPLTPRERTVLTLLNDHGTTRDVADALGVSVNTVRKQVLATYAKLGVHDREAALRRGHDLGILGTHDPPR